MLHIIVYSRYVKGRCLATFRITIDIAPLNAKKKDEEGCVSIDEADILY